MPLRTVLYDRERPGFASLPQRIKTAVLPQDNLLHQVSASFGEADNQRANRYAASVRQHLRLRSSRFSSMDAIDHYRHGAQFAGL
jgi:hypothetical protein